MASPETKLINKVRKMLFKGPNHCFNEILKFSGLVTQLEAYAWSLSSEQNQFLNCLIRLREEMVADAPFILSIKEDIEQNRRAMWYILREICSLKEEIEIYEGNLATLSHEEKTIIYQTTNSDQDLAKLKDRIEEIKNNIQENTTNALIKREILMVLKAEMCDLGEDLYMLMNKSKIANSFKQTIENFWTATIDAINFL
jgi:chromosome segregation ATPase